MTTIAAERAALSRLGQGLRLRSQWGATRSYTDPRSVSEPASDQFVHISVTNPDSYANDDVHAKVIEKIGISRFPATGISYNRGISMSAKRFEFQPIGRRGAHTGSWSGNCTRSGCPFKGDNVSSPNHNVTGRGYVIMQNVDDPVSAAQLDALARTMAADRLAGFVSKSAKIHGHRCVSTKSCPGDKMWALMGQLKLKIDHYVKNGFGVPPVPPKPPVPIGDDMPLIYKFGSSRHRMVVGDRVVGISEADFTRNNGKPGFATGVFDNATCEELEKLVPEVEPAT